MALSKSINKEVNKPDSAVVGVFWALVGVFVFILAQFFVPAIRDFFRGTLLFLLPLIIFSFLGAALIFLTLKRGVSGRLRKFLLLTGASAAGFFISIFLHNFIYGLFIILFGPDFWDRIGLGDEPLFFFIALLICPLAFLIGTIGSLLLLKSHLSNPQ